MSRAGNATWVDILGRGTGVAASAVLALLVLLAVAETLLWSVFDRSYAALPELEGLLLPWLALLAGAYGVHAGLHLGLDFLVSRLPARWQTLTRRFSAAWVALFGLLLTLYGARLVSTVSNTLPATGLPAALGYLPASLAGLLIALFAARQALEPADG